MIGWVPKGHPASVVLIRDAAGMPSEEAKLATAARFYGLDIRVEAMGPDKSAAALAAIRLPETIAVVVEAGALTALDEHRLESSLERFSGHHVPVLVAGITPQTPVGVLKEWSNGTVHGVSDLAPGSDAAYMVGQGGEITGELSGIELPLPGQSETFFATGSGRGDTLLGFHRGAKFAPSFMKVILHRQEIFLLCANGGSISSSTAPRSPALVEAFAEIAPYMIFLKHAAGDRGWSFPHHYANLTIDDPWLREPYGHLDYAGLLREMTRHSFHTTIAFIPWNYDRSEPAVVSLFRDHPDRFSISVHGDNHDHKEFEDFRSKPLDVQLADLRQGTARMEEFQKLTGLPFDRVFVFPHSIGEETILEHLKLQNYLATINSTMVPMGARQPSDPLFYLRPVSTSFGNFPSLLRYPADMPNPGPVIAISAFLNDPILFYTHQQFFARGIDAFDAVADKTNSVEPATQWQSAGTIASHLYLFRANEHAGYDVFSYSRYAEFENASGRTLVYNVTKREPDPNLIESVSANGRPCAFQIEDGLLHCTVIVAPGRTGSFAVAYKNAGIIRPTDIRHSSIRISLLRWASDFRDIQLSRFHLGDAVSEYYYRHALTSMQGSAILAVLALVLIAPFLILRVIIKGRRTGARARAPRRDRLAHSDSVHSSTRGMSIGDRRS